MRPRPTLWTAIFLLLSISIVPQALSYKQEPTDAFVHQYITNESKRFVTGMPYEMQKHLRIALDSNIDDSFTPGIDDIISGSGEEDLAQSTTREWYRNHFWEPDIAVVQGMPWLDKYPVGLESYQSNYNKARTYWRTHAIPLYLSGEKDEAYYYLGRIAHLLQDATVPAHMHLDCHFPYIWPCGDDSLEEFLVLNNNFYGQGQNVPNFLHFDSDNLLTEGINGYSVGPYYYDKLIPGFPWNTVEPEPSDYFFRLWWYTAQKTQYISSDDAGNDFDYEDLNGNIHQWESSGASSMNLWSDTGYCEDDFVTSEMLSEDDNTNSGENVASVADMVIPHAMRSTAALYALFTDTVNSYSWPTFHHDNRRTGLSILKGHASSQHQLRTMNVALQYGILSDVFTRISSADINRDGKIESIIVVSDIHYEPNSVLGTVQQTAKSESDTNIFLTDDEEVPYGSWIYVVGRSSRTNREYVISSQPFTDIIQGAPTIGNTFGTEDNIEFFVGGKSGIWAFSVIDTEIYERWHFEPEERFSEYLGDFSKGETANIALEDIDHDGVFEIIFADFEFPLDDWNGKLYVLSDQGNNFHILAEHSLSNGGASGAVSVYDIDSDYYPEIIVPTYYGIKVFDYVRGVGDEPGELSLKCENSHGRLEGAAVISDIDYDNDFELIYTSSDSGCAQERTCLNTLYITDANTCTLEKTIALGTLFSRVSPSVANIDEDNNLEIILRPQKTYAFNDYSKVVCYDAENEDIDCEYDNSGRLVSTGSTSIFDIDGDGDYEIIIPDNESYMRVLHGNGGQQFFSFLFDGQVGSSPSIADIDGDGRADIAVKRSGSPLAIFSVVSSPEIDKKLTIVNNITAIAGDYISLSENHAFFISNVSDFYKNIFSNNFIYENLSSYLHCPECISKYSFPFNSSGEWQSTVNDSGEYFALVEIIPDNISEQTISSSNELFDFIKLQIFTQETKLIDSFVVGNTEVESSVINFSDSLENDFVIVIPKNASIEFAEIVLEEI